MKKITEKCSDVFSISRLQNRDMGCTRAPLGAHGETSQSFCQGLLPFHKVLEEFDSCTEQKLEVDDLSES